MQSIYRTICSLYAVYMQSIYRTIYRTICRTICRTIYRNFKNKFTCMCRKRVLDGTYPSPCSPTEQCPDTVTR